MFANCNNGDGVTMGRSTGYAGLHDCNRAIRDIATSADWQSGKLARQLERLVKVAARYMMGVGRERTGPGRHSFL